MEKPRSVLKWPRGSQRIFKKKWKKELDYKLRKELFCFTDNKIAVHFEYEWRNEKGEVSTSGVHPLKRFLGRIKII